MLEKKFPATIPHRGNIAGYIRLRAPHYLWFAARILLTMAMLQAAGFSQVLAGAPSEDRTPYAGPKPARIGIDSDGHMHIQPKDRCPLCAMLPARYPEFSCAMKLSDQRTFYFCSPRCLLRVWAAPERFLNASRRDISRIIVRHYFTGKQIDGNSAVWVSGGNVIGPMGPAIVPLENRTEVTAFKKRHGADRVFHLNEPSPAEWKKILGPP